MKKEEGETVAAIGDDDDSNRNTELLTINSTCQNGRNGNLLTINTNNNNRSNTNCGCSDNDTITANANIVPDCNTNGRTGRFTGCYRRR